MKNTAILVALIALALPANSETISVVGGYWQRTANVSYEIKTDADAEALYKRLRAATRSVCGTRGEVLIVQQRQARECFAPTLQSAVEQVADPRVTAIHEAAK